MKGRPATVLTSSVVKGVRFEKVKRVVNKK